MGEVILEVMATHPEHRLIVLCGHTHGEGETQPLPNVQILTGGADYGHPIVQRMLEFD
jgi:Icc protein